MPSPLGEVRSSQLVTTYGSGAIVPVGDQSFIIAGIDQWVPRELDVHEPRLERLLQVQGFVRPPTSEQRRDVPVRRFPDTHYCPACRRLDRHSFFTSGDGSQCNDCQVPLVPSRFVIACERGHIDEFPYFEWVHKGRGGNGARSDTSRHRLSLSTTGRTASLRDVVVTCDCGVPSVSLDGAFGKQALDPVKRCSGRRPWLGRDAQESCGLNCRTLQRGASNVWFSVLRSALSIPPWSEAAFKAVERQWNVLKHVPSDGLRKTLEGMGIAERTQIPVEELIDAVVRRKEGRVAPADTVEELKAQEYEALVLGRAEISREQDFVSTSVALDGLAAEWFEQVSAVRRLREVRVLTGFRRLQPPSPSDPPELVAPISQAEPEWYPAIEVIGEGVFLRLREDRLKEWEHTLAVQQRAARIDDRHTRRFAAFASAPDRHISARLLLVHALSHALIQRWSLDSGYPAASLRERLYCSDKMAGLLLFTATTDSAGSLGGVVAQAESERLATTLQEALESAAWCSADPVCIETEVSGVDGLNAAACHSCLLLPETSCEEQNLLLDRAFLVGTPSTPDIAFFPRRDLRI